MAIFGSKGYKVSLRGRSGVLYKEDDRRVLIDAEMLTGSTNLVIYFDRLKLWEEPRKLITREEREKIRENVTSELEKHGLVIEWD
jgi:hypothetical protein